MKKEKEQTEPKEENLTAPDRVRNFFKELVPYVVIVFIVAMIRIFLVTPVKVNGASMYPYLKDGEVLLLNKFDNKYERYDIIVADVPNTKVIKRIIGLPGENIAYKDCKLYINGKVQEDYVSECITSDFSLEELYGYVVIPEGHYFVMGDNRQESSDSRDLRIGLISTEQIQGTATFRLTPFKRFGVLKK